MTRLTDAMRALEKIAAHRSPGYEGHAHHCDYKRFDQSNRDIAREALAALAAQEREKRLPAIANPDDVTMTLRRLAKHDTCVAHDWGEDPEYDHTGVLLEAADEIDQLRRERDELRGKLEACWRGRDEAEKQRDEAVLHVRALLSFFGAKKTYGEWEDENGDSITAQLKHARDFLATLKGSGEG